MSLLDRYLRIRMISAEPESLLTKLSFSDVELMDITYIDFLTVEIKIRKSQLSAAKKILTGSGSNYQIIKREGILWSIQGVAKRPVLLAGAVLFLLLSYVLPGRIFFIRVTGNERIPEKQILSQAQSCGISFATKASQVRSEDVKNQLLGMLPELQWLGITTSGSVATIHVKERSTPVDLQNQENMVASIVAARDGIITEATIHKGNPLFLLGQSVKEGDILVSGYTDCGIKLKAEHAQAEVYAHTLRRNQFVALLPTEMRGSYVRQHTCYRLRIGKKVINLCNHSGIPDATCVKMYSEDYWTLPGGFQLPVSVTKVNYLFCETAEAVISAEESYAWLPQFSREYLQQQMIAGEILEEDLQWEISNDICRMMGNYACHEMIGQVKYEEIIEQNAEDN